MPVTVYVTDVPLVMDTSCIPDEQWIEHGPGLFRVVVGGEQAWEICLDHWHGMSWRQIGDKHGVSHMTARRWVTIAKQNMRQAGLNADAVRGYATASQSQGAASGSF